MFTLHHLLSLFSPPANIINLCFRFSPPACSIVTTTMLYNPLHLLHQLLCPSMPYYLFSTPPTTLLFPTFSVPALIYTPATQSRPPCSHPLQVCLNMLPSCLNPRVLLLPCPHATVLPCTSRDTATSSSLCCLLFCAPASEVIISFLLSFLTDLLYV